MTNVLHDFGQFAEHSDVFIVGDHEALEKLRDAINWALLYDRATSDTFTNDGEGYTINIVKANEETMDNLRRPYYYEHSADYRKDAINPWDLVKDG